MIQHPGNDGHCHVLFPSLAVLRRLVVLLLMTGCAKVGDPLPPRVDLPEPVTGLELVQVADQIHLRFPSLGPEIQFVEVYRGCAPPSSDADLSLFDVIEAERLREDLKAGRRIWEGPSMQTGLTCTFAVRTINRMGARSVLSNRVATSQVPWALAPSNLRHRVVRDRILLIWDPPLQNADGSVPPEIRGYLVNSAYVVSESRFEDTDFRLGEGRVYQVQTISRHSDPTVLSAPSEPLEVIPLDTIPPPAPRNLTAVYFQNRVQLIWDPIEDAGLAGFKVYRGSDPDTMSLISTLERTARFSDFQVEAWRTYFYRVSSVDQFGNESQPSETVEVRIE